MVVTPATVRSTINPNSEMGCPDTFATGFPGRSSADCQSARQQVTNLRYAFGGIATSEFGINSCPMPIRKSELVMSEGNLTTRPRVARGCKW